MDGKLKALEGKIEQSSHLHQEYLTQRASSGYLCARKQSRAAELRQQLQHKEEEHFMQRVLSIQRKTEHSQMRRVQGSPEPPTPHSHTSAEQRRSLQSKSDQRMRERLEMLRDNKIEKARQVHHSQLVRQSALHSERYYLRRRDVEENLKRNQLLEQRKKAEILRRINTRLLSR